MNKSVRQDSKEVDIYSIAAAIRFERSLIAGLSFLIILLKEPSISYFLIITSLIGALIAPRYELIRLFYQYIIKTILRRDIFRFGNRYPGAFLLEDDAERFMFLIIAVFNGLGIMLFHFGSSWWIAPITIVAAGTTLSATIGVCLMALMYAAVKDRKRTHIET